MDNVDNQFVSNDLHLDHNRRNKLISDDLIHKYQYRHFIKFNILPHLLFVFLATYLVLMNSLEIKKTDIITALLLWVITGLGITVGYHRLFTHKSFKAKRPLRIALHIFGMMAGQGAASSWAAIHRMHHKYSDKTGDPHSPNISDTKQLGLVEGIAHSHFVWMKKHNYPNVLHYTPDLVKDKDIVALDKHYEKICYLGLIIPAAISFYFEPTIVALLNGFLVGGLFRLIFLGHTIWAINSFLHRFGNRDFNTKDGSRNVGFISVISFGESWHNNHHAFPGSAAFGLKWYQIDFGYYFIKLMEIVSLATDIKKPKPSTLERSYHE
jgi:stearoyl-CoA desaturase (Delta-9 desaturase)